jgi:feruloyl esterase
MTVAAKAITAAFYGSAPTRSYWNGCSTGGRQGLMEASRYPADDDGIIAGAPVNYRTHQMTAELWIAQAVHGNEAAYIPPAKYPAIHRAALDACDAKDGLKDGLIDDPRQCTFDPKISSWVRSTRSTTTRASSMRRQRRARWTTRSSCSWCRE